MHRSDILIIVLFLLSVIIGCNRLQERNRGEHEVSGGNIVISGTLQQGEESMVVLDEMTAREFVPVDTARCNSKGVFRIEFNADQPAFYALRIAESGYITLLLEPGESVEFKGTSGNIQPYEVSGSEGSELINQLASNHKQAIDSMASISRKNRESLARPDYQAVKLKLDRGFDSIATAFYEYSLDFINDHSSSLSILIALYNQYGYGLPVFNPETDFEVYTFVDSVLSIHYPDFEAVELLHSQVEAARQQMQRANSFSGLAPGDRAPDFVMKDQEGNSMSLGELKGRYVLLSFWAAWSKPSRDENSYLKKAFNSYAGQNFTILQVSVDDNRSEWIGAIETDELNWYHVSDLQRWESGVNDLYQIEKIPSNFLVSPEGKIIARDIFGEDLMIMLEKTLKL